MYFYFPCEKHFLIFKLWSSFLFPRKWNIEILSYQSFSLDFLLNPSPFILPEKLRIRGFIHILFFDSVKSDSCRNILILAKKKKKKTSIEQLNFFFKGLNICYCLHIYYLSTETRSQINGEISHSIWPAYVQVYMYGHTAERVKRDVKNMRPRNTLAKPRHCLQTALLYYS